jgi:flagellar hook-basal body complex protein FliE
MNTINALTGTAKLMQRLPEKQTGPGFAERLTSAVTEVNTKQHMADNSIERVVKGELGIHEGMLSIEEADVSMKLLLKVRAKAMQAYQEIMKMPV